MTKSQSARLQRFSLEERRQMTEKARSAIKRDLESSLEIKIQRALESLGEQYEKHIFIGNRNYDILIPPNIVIECQGDYWHANPKAYKETDILYAGMTAESIWKRDEYKDTLARKHGYTVIPLWESDIVSLSEIELQTLVKQEIDNVRSSND